MAWQSVREDRDPAHGLGVLDDAASVLHHLRGVAVAAMQGDDERMLCPGADQGGRIGAVVPVDPAVVEGLRGDRPDRSRHRGPGAEIGDGLRRCLGGTHPGQDRQRPRKQSHRQSPGAVKGLWPSYCAP